MRNLYGYKDNHFVAALFACLMIVFWFLFVGIIVGAAPYAHGAEDTLLEIALK